MNNNKIHRNYRKRRNNFPEKLCIRCFSLGHLREDGCGNNEPQIACSKCYRMNLFSQNCVCSNIIRTNAQKGMTLRLSDESCPRPYIDVIFGGKVIPALINTSSYKSSINLEALDLINAERRKAELSEFSYPGTLEYTICRRNRYLKLLFTISNNQPQLLKLGMQFLMKSGFSMTVDRVTISHKSAVTTSPLTIDFLYNRPQGFQLRKYVKKRKMAMYTEYVEGISPGLQGTNEVTITNEYYEPDVVEENSEDVKEDILDIDTSADDIQMFENEY